MREEFLSAIRRGDRDAVSRMLDLDPSVAELEDDQGVSALLIALYHRQDELAAAIRAKRSSLDLFEAAALGDTARVAELVSSDPAALTAYSPDGWTALHLASFFGHPGVVDLLIDRGAGIDMLSTNMGNTALQAATANRQIAVVRRLVERGADLDYATAQGNFTALHGAANAGSAEIVEILLDAGADPTITTSDGRTAADLARDAHPAVARTIEERQEGESTE